MKFECFGEKELQTLGFIIKHKYWKQNGSLILILITLFFPNIPVHFPICD